MNLAPNLAPSRESEFAMQGMRWSVLVSWPSALGIALLLCYAPVLRGLLHQWNTDPDMGHGFFVPLSVGWIVWRERSKWRELRPSPTLWGAAVLTAGAGLQIAGAFGAGLFAGAVALLISTGGAVLILGGAAFLRAWRFPFLLSLFMLPKLAIVYNRATLPLQLAATQLARGILHLAGVPVVADGSLLQLGQRVFSVDPACNGIRFLLSLAFLGVLFAYRFDEKAWMRVALLAASIPLALGANAVRIAGTVAVGAWSPALAEGAMHTLLGTLVFALAAAGLVGLRGLLNRIYVRF